MPTVELVKTNSERNVRADDKRRKRASWDPSEHPDYDVVTEREAQILLSRRATQRTRWLFELLALATYSEEQG